MGRRLTDTSPEAERVLIDIHRRMTFARKWAIIRDLFRTARALHAIGVRLRHPMATDRDIHEDWLRQTLGSRPSAPCEDPSVFISGQELQVLQTVVAAFTRLGIPYAVGGSLASSVYGFSRHTRDADITVEPFPGQESELVGKLGPDFYASLPAIEEAVRQRSSFNLIHSHTGFKVDVFVRKDTAFEQSALARRVTTAIPDQPDQCLVIHAPEDVILFKLRWYRLGDEVSEQQWKDVLGVLQVQGGRLDEAYLDQWAKELGVDDLLARARQESEV